MRIEKEAEQFSYSCPNSLNLLFAILKRKIKSQLGDDSFEHSPTKWPLVMTNDFFSPFPDSSVSLGTISQSLYVRLVFQVIYQKPS